MKLKHEGFSKERLRCGNDCEDAFHKEWLLRKSGGPNATHIIEHLVPNCTQRDAQVAATVIQWLGSPMGLLFLEEVMKNKRVQHRLIYPLLAKEIL